MIPRGQLSGAVLAGGDSRRMGRDKALLELDGQPLWRRQLTTLQSAGASPVGVVRRASQAPLPLPPSVPLWLDSRVDIGPLAGIEAALQAAPTGWIAITAVDLPRLDAAWFDWLASVCSADCGAIVQHPTGAFEPLAAIYPVAASSTLSSQLERTDYSLQRLASALVAEGRLAVRPLPSDGTTRIENWNTPADRPS